MRLQFSDWLVWTEEQSPYHVHMMKADEEMIFPANELDRLAEVLIRISNSFYPHKAQVHLESDEE